MRILSLVSSGRKDGNTGRIAALIERQLLLVADSQKIDVEIERVSLGQLDIKMCRGCRVCFDKGEGKCPLRDDLLSIRDKMYQADGILVASPVYVEDVNGIMKNWIDRMAFNCHRPAFAGKSTYIVTTSGVGSSNHAINTMKKAFDTWGIGFAGKARFRTGELMKTAEMKSKYSREVRKAAEALFNAVRDNSAEKPSFYSLITFKVQQEYWVKADKYKDTMDYRYWKDKGWLDNGCSYYIPHRANLMKVKIARLIGRIIAAFFI